MSPPSIAAASFCASLTPQLPPRWGSSGNLPMKEIKHESAKTIFQAGINFSHGSPARLVPEDRPDSSAAAAPPHTPARLPDVYGMTRTCRRQSPTKAAAHTWKRGQDNTQPLHTTQTNTRHTERPETQTRDLQTPDAQPARRVCSPPHAHRLGTGSLSVASPSPRTATQRPKSFR